MKPNPRHLLLDLMLATDEDTLSAQHAIAAAKLFNISENSVRVTLARLVSDGLIDTSSRGSYSLSSSAHELADDVATWRTAEHRVRPWTGEYLAVHCGMLGRSDRASLRRRQRALGMLGFAEWERGLYLRPDNIEPDVEAVRARLRKLGLEPEAPVFLTHAFDDASSRQIASLWNGRALASKYRKLSRQLEGWIAVHDQLAPAKAARQSFEIGSDAIRQVIYDPLLPEPLVDVGERAAFFESVRRLDHAGRRCWQRFFEEKTELPSLFNTAEELF